jgi:hypothetical protein
MKAAHCLPQDPLAVFETAIGGETRLAAHQNVSEHGLPLICGRRSHPQCLSRSIDLTQLLPLGGQAQQAIGPERVAWLKHADSPLQQCRRRSDI